MNRSMAELELAVSGIMSELRMRLRMHGITVDASDEVLVDAITGSFAGWVTYKEPKPRPLDRHEECLDCDSGPHRYAPDPDDPDDDGWYTHCDVCEEVWPCPEAGQVDQEALTEARAQYIKLARTHPDKRSAREWSKWHQLRASLQAEGQLPTREEIHGVVDWRDDWRWLLEHSGCWFADLANAYEHLRDEIVSEEFVITHWQAEDFHPNDEDLKALARAIAVRRGEV